MTLTTQQKAALKSDILAAPDTAGKSEDQIAALYNAAASPAFWAWRTSVSRQNIYGDTSVDGTTWDWTIYKGQAVTEQGAWVQMFMGDVTDFSKDNLRLGIAKIFGAANANNTHCLAIGRRQATRCEKLFAVGTGTTASPAKFGVEGTLTAQNVSDAMGGV